MELVETEVGASKELAPPRMRRRVRIFKICRLAFVNVMLTFVVEVFLRSLVFDHLWHGKGVSAFFNHSGELLFHKQTLISCLMTLFASLMGGYSYFLRHRMQRWLFFGVFGVLNSILSQLVLHFLFGYTLVSFSNRVVFDFLYSISMRFLFFEMFRSRILASQFNWRPLFRWRALQDTSLAFVRILVLTLLNMSAL